MASTATINVIDRSIEITNPRELPVIFEPNPAYNYVANADEVYELLQFGRIYMYDSATGVRIDGWNYYDYFPERRPGGGGGGGGVTPAEVQNMINASLVPVDERIDKVEDDISHIDASTVAEYTKNTDIPYGRIVYVTPGQCYQAVKDFTSSDDPSLTPEQALAADVAAGNLVPVVDAEVSELDERVDVIEDWKPGVDDDIDYLKKAIVDAEEMEYYADYESFPAEGKDNITYVDKSTGKTYTWNSTTEAYELMNSNNIIDGSIFNSIL